MTTIEKLFIQIFDRKSYIIEQLQQQADSYTQQLASGLLIDGINPPEWLLNPNCNSNPNELEKEEIISKLLFRPPRDSIPYRRDSIAYSRSDCSRYYQTVFSTKNEMYTETHAPYKVLDASNRPMRTLEGSDNDIGCSLNCVSEQVGSVNSPQNETEVNKGLNVSDEPRTLECPNNGIVCSLKPAAELDDSVNSPRNETDARISSIYAAPDTSLARIQRSKSRQKARELRTNGKTSVKSCLSNENRTHNSFSGDSIPKIDLHQGTQEKPPSDMSKHNDISGATSIAAEGNDRARHSSRLAKSSRSHEKVSFLNDQSKNGSSLEKEELDGGNPLQRTGNSVLQSGQNNGVMEGVNPPDVSLGIYENKTSITRKTRDSQTQSQPICGAITRSRSSSQLRSGMSKSSKPPTSASYNPTSTSVQQSGHGIGVTEAVSNLDFSLGSYVSKTSISGKTQDMQRQNESFCGRITRSRSSSQQTSGINKSSKLGTSASYNSKEGRGPPPHIIDDLTHVLNASNKSMEAVETAQVLNDRSRETQAIKSNEGVLKPVISSSIPASRGIRSRSGPPKEPALGADNLEMAATVVENVPTDAPILLQPVNSGIKLAPVTLCMESEGLDPRHSSDCCMIVKPKQLNFDEIEECELNETCSPLSKKRKLDGFPGQECYPIKEPASLIDHKSVSPFFEQQLPNANVLSSSPKAASAHSDKNIDDRMNNELTNIGLETNENPVVGEVEHNTNVFLHDNIDATCEVSTSPKEVHSIFDEEKHPGKSHLNKDYASSSKMQIEEGDLGEKGEESAAGACTLDKNFDDYTKDETINIGLEMNENPVAKDFEHNSNVSLHDKIDVTCEVNKSPAEFHAIFDEEKHSGKSHYEDHAPSSKMQIIKGDLGDKGEESSPSVYEPVSKNTNSLFISSSTKHGTKDSEDSLDCGSSKSKECEVGTNLKLSSVKLNSANDNSWPMIHQRNIEDQPTCLSDSRDFLVHIQRDAMCCDLETPKNDSHSVKESASILSSKEMYIPQPDDILDEMMCNLPEETESLRELQVAEATTTTKVDDGAVTEDHTSSLKMQIKGAGFKGEESAADSYIRDKNFDESTTSETIDIGLDMNENSVVGDVEHKSKVSLHDNVDVTSDVSTSLKQVPSILDEEKHPGKSHSNEDHASSLKMPSEEGNLFEETESLHELQAEEATVTELDDVAVTDSTNFEISLPNWLSSYGSVQSLNDDKSVVVSDEILPVYESFTINEDLENISLENADLDSLEIPSTTIARASILEQICKSASMQTPSSQFSSSFIKHSTENFYEYITDEMFKDMDLGSNISINEGSEIDNDFPKQEKIDSLQFTTPFSWESKNHYSSPTGKLWERSASSSGSSEKYLSSNPELTCFPIEEDPNSNEEIENDDNVAVGIQEPPTEASELFFQHPIRVSSEMNIQTENDDKMADEVQEPPLESTSVKYPDRYSSSSVNIEASVLKTRDKVKFKPKLHHGIKISRFGEGNRNSSIVTRASTRGNASELSKNKSIMRSGMPRSSKKEAKSNNIVSNISSFIPMVQQKQAAAVCTGKRDIKVKALGAAEAARRREQEKEHERKMKKEALKLERARIGKENAIEMELNKKKKLEEQKKKEADIAARKRQREEEERKQVAKKRKLVAEAQKNQKLQYEKSRVGKMESEKQQGKNAVSAVNKKGAENMRQNKNADKNSLQRRDTELRTDKTLVGAVKQVASVPENPDASSDCGVKETVTSVLEKSPEKVVPMKSTSQEISYDISPYQSEDEDDNEDETNDRPTKKFMPSWASKNRVAMVLPLQQQLKPETIFPLESFCSVDEVLLPRRLQAK